MSFDKSEVFPLQAAETDTGPKRARRSDAVANRELILATAQHLFSEQGVANVCMTAIAEAAEIGKGTLYRGFANKGDLCLALMDEDMRTFQNKTIHLLRSNTDKPALSRLESFLDSLVRFMDFHAPLLHEAQLQGVLHSEAQRRQVSPQMWLPWLRETISRLLLQAEQRSETHGLDIPYLVDAILAPLNADLFIYQREVLGFEIERISSGLRRLVLDGCRQR